MYYHSQKPTADAPYRPSEREQCQNMSGNVSKKETPLSAKQLQALPHLVSGKTFANAATAADVSERTIYRWMNDPDFKSAYLALREVEADIARAELRGLALKAAITLSRAMDQRRPQHQPPCRADRSQSKRQGRRRRGCQEGRPVPIGIRRKGRRHYLPSRIAPIPQPNSKSD